MITGATAGISAVRKTLKNDKNKISITDAQEIEIDKYVQRMLKDIEEYRFINKNDKNLIQEILLRCENRKKLLEKELEILNSREKDRSSEIEGKAIRKTIAELNTRIGELKEMLKEFKNPDREIDKDQSIISDAIEEEKKEDNLTVVPQASDNLEEENIDSAEIGSSTPEKEEPESLDDEDEYASEFVELGNFDADSTEIDSTKSEEKIVPEDKDAKASADLEEIYRLLNNMELSDDADIQNEGPSKSMG